MIVESWVFLCMIIWLPRVRILTNPWSVKILQTAFPDRTASLPNHDLYLCDIRRAAEATLDFRGRRRLQQQPDRFAKILSRLIDGLALAGDVEFRTNGDIEFFFLLDDRRKLFGPLHALHYEREATKNQPLTIDDSTNWLIGLEECAGERVPRWSRRSTFAGDFACWQLSRPCSTYGAQIKELSMRRISIGFYICLQFACLQKKRAMQEDASCEADGTRCGQNCADTTSDTQNCGGCGIACLDPAPFCVAGKCSASCATTCNGLCTDTNSSLHHCGGCGNDCSAATPTHATATCNGSCDFVCDAGYMRNGTQCVAPGGGASCGDTKGLEPGSPWPMWNGCPAHTGRSGLTGPASSPIVKWAVDLDGLVAGSPVVAADGTIYFCASPDDPTQRFLFYAVKPDGTVKWSVANIPCFVHSSPAIGSDGTVFFVDPISFLHALNPVDGKEKYSIGGAAYGGALPIPAIAADGTVYGANNGMALIARKQDGDLFWSLFPYQSGADAAWSAPAIAADGTIYVGASYYAGDAKIYAVTPAGAQKWVFTTDSFSLNGSASIAEDGTIYVPSFDSANANPGQFLYALTPLGQKKWAYKVSGAATQDLAIAADGTIYMLSSQYIPATNKSQASVEAVTPLGQSKWQLVLENDVRTVPLVPPLVDAAGTLYVVTGKNFHAVTPLGQKKWAAPIAGSGAPVIGTNGVIYLPAQGKFYALGL